MKAVLTYPSWISAPATALIGERCFTSLLENLDFRDADCIKLAVSKALGLGVVAGGCVVKVPQIMIIRRSRSGRGISLSAYVLELVSCAINTVYSIRNAYAFSTYGENFFLTLQNAIITVLIIHYTPLVSRRDSNAPRVAAATLAMLASAVGLMVLPAPTLTLLQGLTIPISAIAKVPQIVANERNKSTGNLAAITVTANILGCIARVFTTLTEVKDPLVLWGFILASVLNTVIGIQMIAYWGRGDTAQYHLPTEKTRARVEGVTASNSEKLELQAKGAPLDGRASPPVKQTASRLTPPAYSPTSRASPSAPPAGRKWARKVD